MAPRDSTGGGTMTISTSASQFGHVVTLARMTREERDREVSERVARGFTIYNERVIDGEYLVTLRRIPGRA